MNAIKNPPHNITIKKVKQHTNVIGHDEADKLAKLGAQEPHMLVTPFHHIGHQTPFGLPSLPPPPTPRQSSMTAQSTI